MPHSPNGRNVFATSHITKETLPSESQSPPITAPEQKPQNHSRGRSSPLDMSYAPAKHEGVCEVSSLARGIRRDFRQNVYWENGSRWTPPYFLCSARHNFGTGKREVRFRSCVGNVFKRGTRAPSRQFKSHEVQHYLSKLIPRTSQLLWK